MQSRTHLALEKDAPVSRPVMPAAVGRINVTPHVGGLHHRYDRAAAWQSGDVQSTASLASDLYIDAHIALLTASCSERPHPRWVIQADRGGDTRY
jgi:hypothetical protein